MDTGGMNDDGLQAGAFLRRLSCCPTELDVDVYTKAETLKVNITRPKPVVVRTDDDN